MKGKANKTILLGLGAFGALFGVIGVCSFFPFVLDPSKWDSAEFWSGEAVTVSIALISMAMMALMSVKSNAGNPESELARARVAYNESVKLIDDDLSFGKWVREVFQPSELEIMRENHLRAVGVMKTSIVSLTKPELKALTKADGEKYARITSKQYDAIMDVKEGRVTTTLVPPDYYLSAKSVEAERTITERSGREGSAKAGLIGIDATAKALVVVIPAMILTALVYDVNSGGDTAKAWLDFLSRTFSMLGGMLSGWLTGIRYNNIDANFINLRVAVHRKYSQYRRANEDGRGKESEDR